MQNENFFSIAELDIKICFAESPFNGMHLIPSLEPFREKNLKGELFFNSRLTIPRAPTQRKNANASEPLILEWKHHRRQTRQWRIPVHHQGHTRCQLLPVADQ